MGVKLFLITLIITLVPRLGFAGDINQFTDSEGILHISNVETRTNLEDKNLQKFALPNSTLRKLPITPSVCDPELQKETFVSAVGSSELAPPEGEDQNSSSVKKLMENVYEAAKKLQKGSAAPGEPVEGEITTGADLLPNSHVGGSILIYKDPKGVINIHNRRERAIKSLIQVAARPAPEDKTFLPGPNLIQPIAWLAATKTLESVPTVLPTCPEDTVHHYKNQQGLLCITNTPPPEKSSIPVIRIDDKVARMHSGISGRQTIFARRSWQGIYHIYNHAAVLVRDRGSPVAFLEKLSPDLEAAIVEAAQIYHLPVSLILALIRNESNFVAQAVSPKGAMGMMQLMPGTARLLGVQDPFSFRENINGGCRYFRYLLNDFEGSIPLALAAYNAGPKRVISAGYQVPPIKETQEFVTQVMALYYILEKLSAYKL